MNIKDQIMSMDTMLPPTIVQTVGKRYAVAGSNWVEITDDNIDLDMIREWWQEGLTNRTPPPASEQYIDDSWEVPSSTGKGSYLVSTKFGKWECDCMAFQFGRGRDCKHIKQIKEDLGMEP